MQQETLAELADIYYWVEFVNRQHAKLLELTIGVTAPLSNSTALRTQQMGFIRNGIDKLEPKLTHLLGQIK